MQLNLLSTCATCRRKTFYFSFYRTGNHCPNPMKRKAKVSSAKCQLTMSRYMSWCHNICLRVCELCSTEFRSPLFEWDPETFLKQFKVEILIVFMLMCIPLRYQPTNRCLIVHSLWLYNLIVHSLWLYNLIVHSLWLCNLIVHTFWLYNLIVHSLWLCNLIVHTLWLYDIIVHSLWLYNLIVHTLWLYDLIVHSLWLYDLIVHTLWLCDLIVHSVWLYNLIVHTFWLYDLIVHTFWLYDLIVHSLWLYNRPAQPFSVAGHFHMTKFIAGTTQQTPWFW